MSVLERVDSPQDVKQLSLIEMEELAKDIRESLIDVISKNGGHLTPNLGVVEMSISLHKVFDSPKDKIIFDTSHQSYVHKLLTGRKANFPTLRQYQGFSGYQERKESIHDPWGSGHASTSISAAVGFAQARDLQKQDYNVIAIIGDGALTGGMAFEGLNYLGDKGMNVIVILNDNKLAYTPTPGGLAAYTNRLSEHNKIFKSPIFTQVRSDIHYLLDRTAKDDQRTLEVIGRLREAALSVLSAGIVFEELGFTYIGPVDGHNTGLMIETLEKAKAMTGPVLIHVLTTKGKGYEPVEGDKDSDLGKWHGVGAFDPENAEFMKKAGAPPAWSAVFGKKLAELGKANEKIVAVTAAMTLGTGLQTFRDACPERFFDVGICEQHAVTYCAGMAAGGLKPFATIYSTFLQRAWDQTIHDVCLQNLPVTFCMDRAGLVEDGPTAHGVFDIAFMRMVPNMTAMAPAFATELEQMLDFAAKFNAPIAMRYPRGEATASPTPVPPIQLGKGFIVQEEGHDVALIGYGAMVNTAMQAAKLLSEKGIKATVVNARFVKPLDEKLILDVAKKCGKVVTIEEGVAMGGFGSAVAELLEREQANAKLKILGIPDHFVEHGKESILREKVGLHPAGIAAAAEALVHGKTPTPSPAGHTTSRA
ncbi:MAG TPA: 1-deoxy-D-xylulose-5-phosphate synthase [Candidatus Norongarragalinales archaeon]|jgi:1-deoxy-D-xylulose-5-phosphate synthase|nr:1-deoxy-D-xylulose-5-phosphate synthase [Candidatus Norongarragalinales archaeon]